MALSHPEDIVYVFETGSHYGIHCRAQDGLKFAATQLATLAS